MVPRLALFKSTTSPVLLAEMKGLGAPPFTHSTTRRCSVAVPSAMAVARKSGGAAPKGLTIPSTRSSGCAAATPLSSSVPVLTA